MDVFWGFLFKHPQMNPFMLKQPNECIKIRSDSMETPNQIQWKPLRGEFVVSLLSLPFFSHSLTTTYSNLSCSCSAHNNCAQTYKQRFYSGINAPMLMTHIIVGMDASLNKRISRHEEFCKGFGFAASEEL